MESARDLVDFPEDLIHEILLRLSVKTLIRFKCVCKCWKAIIESPSFVGRHFLDESNHEHLLFRQSRPTRRTLVYFDNTFTRYEEPKHLQMPRNVAALVGPLNGIFCVVSFSKKMALLNPATRWFKPLPVIGHVIPSHLEVDFDQLGFGIDPVCESYKLVLIRYFKDTHAQSHPPVVYVYDSRADSWRHLEDTYLVTSGGRRISSLCNTYKSGAYYWLADIDGHAVGVLVFDMSSEIFREVPLPDDLYITSGADLALFGDSIAFIAYDTDDTYEHMSIWVMEKEGCWNKMFKIGTFEISIRPFFLWNENLLFEGPSQLSLYDVYSRRLRILRAGRERDQCYYQRFFPYKESLFSLKGERNKCHHWDAFSDLVLDFFK